MCWYIGIADVSCCAIETEPHGDLHHCSSALSAQVGELKHIRIGHDNTGMGPAWHLQVCNQILNRRRACETFAALIGLALHITI
jgi:hypothetical protein